MNHGENVILLGPPGVGKTHLAIALGMEAVAHGHNVYFIAVPELLDELAHDVQMNRLGERLNKLRVPTLLILDEMGCAPRGAKVPCGLRGPPPVVAATG
jgi:DNA replication protein DnaC